MAVFSYLKDISWSDIFQINILITTCTFDVMYKGRWISPMTDDLVYQEEDYTAVFTKPPQAMSFNFLLIFRWNTIGVWVNSILITFQQSGNHQISVWSLTYRLNSVWLPFNFKLIEIRALKSLFSPNRWTIFLITFSVNAHYCDMELIITCGRHMGGLTTSNENKANL